jgi:hypothetical protein
MGVGGEQQASDYRSKPATHVRPFQAVLNAVPDPCILVHPWHGVLIVRPRAHPQRILVCIEIQPRREIL